MGARAHHMFCVAVPDHNVGIAAHRQRPLLGIKTKHLGGIGGDEFNKAAGRDASAAHACIPQHIETIFDAGHAVGNFGEAFLAQHLLRLIMPRAVVGAQRGDVTGAQAAPECGLIALLAQRGRADIFGPPKLIGGRA